MEIEAHRQRHIAELARSQQEGWLLRRDGFRSPSPREGPDKCHPADPHRRSARIISLIPEGVVGNKATVQQRTTGSNEFDIASIKGLRGGPGNGKIQPDSFVHNLFAKKHRPAVSDLEIVKRGSGREKVLVSLKPAMAIRLPLMTGR